MPATSNRQKIKPGRNVEHEYYLHPTKGYKRKRPRERAEYAYNEWKLNNLFGVKPKIDLTKSVRGSVVRAD